MMTEIMNDIQTLENALIAFEEGAGDEKRMAIYALERMMERKRQAAAEFEAELDRLYMQDSDGIGEGQVA